jgi:putative phosphoesterase
MRVAALYDVHGNLPALEAVLAEVEREQPDAVVFGGDIIAGPMPRETLEAAQRLGERAHLIRGNADRVVVEVRRGEREPTGVFAGTDWIAEQLTDDQIELLAGLPLTLTLDVDGAGVVCFFHATPRDDEEIFTAITPLERLEPMLAGADHGVLVCGHTHVQFDRVVGMRRLVNAGSVGMPYEDSPGARWAMLGPDVDLRRTPYELEVAAARIRASGWPLAGEFVEKYLFAPPSAADATEHFERMASAAEASVR